MKILHPITGWLANQWVWQGSRFLLDAAFGLYRKRFKLLQEWGVLDGSASGAGAASLLDVGCGSGHYATCCDGDYLGIDLSERYIARARRRFPEGGNKSFRCVDVQTLVHEQRNFDTVLLVDILHHLPDDVAIEVLQTAQRLGRRWIVNFEPIKDQTNRVGRWIVNNDRGEFMRPLDNLHQLFEDARVPVSQSVELYLGPVAPAPSCARPRQRLRRTTIPHSLSAKQAKELPDSIPSPPVLRGRGLG